MTNFCPRGTDRANAIAARLALARGRTYDPTNTPAPPRDRRRDGKGGAHMAELAEIVARLADAKVAEDKAKAARVAIEQELAAAVGVPDAWTGSSTSDIGAFKVTCKRLENVKVDAAALEECFKNLPVELVQLARPCFRWKPEIDKKAWDKAPDQITAALAPAITRTPGKISFTLKEIEK